MLRPVTAETFDVLITLSEEPKKDGFKKDHIDAANATAGDPTFLDKMDQTATMQSSGRDMMLYRYIVTITPKYENKNDIVVKVKSFYDQECRHRRCTCACDACRLYGRHGYADGEGRQRGSERQNVRS